MEICPHNECTGCYACVSACKHDCIKMEEDELGAIHPYVDDDKCVNCGACRKVCPNNAPLDFKYPIRKVIINTSNMFMYFIAIIICIPPYIIYM